MLTYLMVNIFFLYLNVLMCILKIIIRLIMYAALRFGVGTAIELFFINATTNNLVLFLHCE